MRRSTPSRRPLAAVAVAATLLLSACGGTPTEAEDAADATGSTVGSRAATSGTRRPLAFAATTTSAPEVDEPVPAAEPLDAAVAPLTGLPTPTGRSSGARPWR